MAETSHNIGRVEWQRSEGQFLYSELANIVLPNMVEMVTDEAIDSAEDVVMNRFWEIPRDPWLLPIIAADVMTDLPYDEMPDFKDAIKRGSKPTALRLHERYTFDKVPKDVFREAVRTAAHFPISTLSELDLNYRIRHEEGLVEDEADIVRIVSTKAFSDLIHQMAFAPNGYWNGSMSNASQLVIGRRSYEGPAHYINGNDLDDDPRSPIGFILAPNKQRKAIAKVNSTSLDPPMEDLRLHAGRSEELSKAASIGCPVAHHGPSFNSVSERQNATRLSRAFGRSQKDIRLPREKTGIDLGLTAYVDILKRVLNYKSQML